MRRSVFQDRDVTITKDTGYIGECEKSSSHGKG